MAQNLARRKVRSRDSQTQKEIDRQHTLLSADLDRRALKGNATMEDWRHYKEYTGLTKNEKRERFQIRLQRNEILDDLKKVRRSYTGHYDDSKSPIENIQSALRHQCQTPLRSSRLDVPNAYPIRKAKSMESMLVTRSTSPTSAETGVQRPKTVHSGRKPSSKTAKSTKVNQ